MLCQTQTRMKKPVYLILLAILVLFTGSCKKDVPSGNTNLGTLQLIGARVGNTSLVYQGENLNMPYNKNIIIDFTGALDTSTVRTSISLKQADQTNVTLTYAYLNEFKSVVLIPSKSLASLSSYTLEINSGLKGASGQSFSGITYNFVTVTGKVTLDYATLNGISITPITSYKNINPEKITLVVHFSQSLDSASYKPYFGLSGGTMLSYSISDSNRTVTLTNLSSLKGYSSYTFSISNTLTSFNGYTFDGFSRGFFTAIDSISNYPVISDDELLTLVEQQTFKYFWDFGHPSCGLARERNSSGDVVTIGGSGFGIMAMAVGMERGFITRADGLTRLDQILSFLETCDRYHGAWPHWINGSTGKTIPFSQYDDGADLVETSYMLEGLLTMRQYLDSTVTEEKSLQNRITALYDSVEFDWFTQGQNVLYWHWSPDYAFIMNMPIRGWNEALIVYVLAASSPTHSISKAVYDQGWARNGGIKNGKTFYSYTLPLGEDYGGPLFFAHYSFMGLDPRNLSDAYANYWQQNVNHSMINWAYCTANPKGYLDYSSSSWGLTASDNPTGYNAQSPTNDLGVITPTAALSSFPYTPVQSMNALRHFYYLLGDKLWGPYGFYDAYSVSSGWWAGSYLAIDEGPIICMIENYRTQLLWNKFMSAPEIRAGLPKLGFSY